MILVVVGDAMARPLVDELEANRDRYDTANLWVIGSGGAMLSETTKKRILELLPDRMIADGFGSSETGVLGSKAGRGGATFVRERSDVRPRRRRQEGRARLGRRRTGSRAAATSRCATTRIPRRPPRPSSSSTASAGCCPATWRPSRTTARSRSSAAARRRSTPAARRSSPTRSKARSRIIPPSRTRSWWACPTTAGASASSRSCSRAIAAPRRRSRSCSSTAASPSPATRCRATSCSSTRSCARRRGSRTIEWAKERAMEALVSS